MRVWAGRKSTIYIDPYVTRDYKIYVEGARVDEVAMPEEKAHLGRAKGVYYGFQYRRQRRKMYRRLTFGAVPGYAPICFDTGDPRTVQKGCEQRVLRINPYPNLQVLQEFQAFCRIKFAKWFGRLGQASIMPFQEWLDSLQNVNEKRKAEFSEAEEKNRGGPPPIEVARKVECFIKTEFYGLFKFPRWIMSRKDQFKVFFGPIVKAMEKVVYQLKFFVKHMSMAERAKRVAELECAGRRYYIADFTAFESSFIACVQKACEFELIDALVPWWVFGTFAKRVLSGWNKLVIKNLFVVVMLLARRMSGEMSTSLFNGIANLMITKFLVHRKGGHVSILVEGDDSIFSTTVELTAQDYASLGFSVKLVEVTSPTFPIPLNPDVEAGSIAFCGITFSTDGQAMKEPRKFIQGFGWTSSFISAGPHLLDQLLRAKALSACYEAPQCPIIGAFARKALSLTEGVSIEDRILDTVINPHAANGYGKDDLESGKIPQFSPTMQTRICFEKIFGVGVDVQVAIERAVSDNEMHKVAELLPPTFDQLYFSARYVVAA